MVKNMLNLTIRYIWYEEYNHNYFFPSHSHNFYEMVYYTNGTGVLTANKSSYSIEDNDYIIVPPNTIHHENQHINSKKICMAFYCDEELPLIRKKDFSQKIYKILKDIYKESRNLHFNSEDYFSTKLNEMFIYINRDINSNNKTSITNFEYIINNIDEKFTQKHLLPEYAKQLNISYDYFRHKFKEITGYSPQDYIINKRLEMACDLLVSTNLSCTEISDKCGFSDSAQFSKMFKEKYNLSPLQYRKIDTTKNN